MNHVEAAVAHAGVSLDSVLGPFEVSSPVACTPAAAWRAVTALVTAARVVGEREYARAIAQGHPDLSVQGFHANAAEMAHRTAPAGSLSLEALLDAVVQYG
ncbi:hypothetical protein [Kutzneria buriramensis]|uniref:Uncharacterized protein n=1 Tax=Kutzneria buriramensis TaxID=1045776 RepID=A0A3E0GTF6_9PSEU|nr:hypothetical protein [Kutzneria buriramensis]REH27003.1 hypothetical protein BCF44_13158 [Kutzneria buriramensis]